MLLNPRSTIRHNRWVIAGFPRIWLNCSILLGCLLAVVAFGRRDAEVAEALWQPTYRRYAVPVVDFAEVRKRGAGEAIHRAIEDLSQPGLVGIVGCPLCRMYSMTPSCRWLTTACRAGVVEELVTILRVRDCFGPRDRT